MKRSELLKLKINKNIFITPENNSIIFFSENKDIIRIQEYEFILLTDRLEECFNALLAEKTYSSDLTFPNGATVKVTTEPKFQICTVDKDCIEINSFACFIMFLENLFRVMVCALFSDQAQFQAFNSIRATYDNSDTEEKEKIISIFQLYSDKGNYIRNICLNNNIRDDLIYTSLLIHGEAIASLLLFQESCDLFKKISR